MRVVAIEDIEKGAFVEGDDCDFKRQVNIDDAEGRRRFLDDVVAFLNRGPAHIFIGVREEKGKFQSFAPMNGNPDQFVQRLLSIVQAGVHPTPFEVSVRAMEVGEGWIIDVDLPPHFNGPFQNAYSGAFLIRTGSKNSPILRDTLQSYFTKQAEWLAAVERLAAEEDERISRTGGMTMKGPYLQIAILPRQHFDHSTPIFTQDEHWRRMAPAFGDHMPAMFRGGEVGHEAIGVGGDGAGADRLLIRDDWFVHAHVAWPLWIDPGLDRLRIYEFKEDLPAYLSELDEFFERCGITGPFAVTIALLELQRDLTVGRYFRNVHSVRLVRPAIVEKVADPTLITKFLGRVRSTTIYG